MDRSSGDSDIKGTKRYRTLVTSPRPDYIDAAIVSTPHHQMSPSIVASSHDDKVTSAMASTIISLRKGGRSSVTSLVESLDVMSDRDDQTARQDDHEQHRYQKSLQFPDLLRNASLAEFDPMIGQ